MDGGFPRLYRNIYGEIVKYQFARFRENYGYLGGPACHCGEPSRHLRFRRGLSHVAAGYCEIATAPAETRNDKLGGLLHPEGRSDKLASASLPCHCEEGASPTWQSREGSHDFAGGFPMLRPVLRDCHALLRKARNDKSGSVCRFDGNLFLLPVPSRDCHGPLGPRNDKPGDLLPSEERSDKLARAFFPCHCEERSDAAISSRHLRIRRGLPHVPAGAARLPRLLRSLAMTNLGAVTIFMIARANRQHRAGPGSPRSPLFPPFRYFYINISGLNPQNSGKKSTKLEITHRFFLPGVVY